MRFFEHSDRLPVSTLVMTESAKTHGQWSSTFSTLEVLNLDYEFLQSILSSAGFTRVNSFSDYQGSPFSKSTSRDLIMLAKKKSRLHSNQA